MSKGKYVSHTEAERQEMLNTIGVEKLEDLYQDVPIGMKETSLNLPDGQSELEVSQAISKLAEQNHVYHDVYRGAGAYRHYIPALVRQIASKEEFLTAYTPYQAEISQGVLQSIFEFQTMICELTGMDVANASVYDGATAAAEAMNMVVDRRKKVVLISDSIHPMVKETMLTYATGMGVTLRTVPTQNGVTDLTKLEEMMSKDVAGVYVEHPNFYGMLEPAERIGEIVHEVGAHYILGVKPIASMILKSAREYGADIAVGEGQSLGIPLSFGGPYLGFMATTTRRIRQLPGRIVGQTEDEAGKRAFVLTLQAREQHIRREKAQSNVCSNQAHCALTASIYMAVMGVQGLTEVARQSHAKAHYLAEQLATIPGFDLVYSGDYFNEFLMTTPIEAQSLVQQLEAHDILAGLPVGENIFWCATEVNTKEAIDALVTAIKEVVA
ncbi:aminomethyl-transferring glycine dehydrogenase subunit GcvPA [Vagococcus lutrae]|uniref:aminomethyl-transferring glycine dehydrogenase subunit GcvPA n=1 Tax=Vagococcus lutrae TaxID=81947 RepID=UPI00144446E9|nr:aminomethyl-transferring glycine dehydrogenase subunit GcvPA [Vagococcus lutrae]NKZ27878.1 aminomethyl-transferring glycine dehydrogenase subunit GcvPA [Vagococcus lutrae]